MMTSNEIKKLMQRANDFHISENPEYGDCSWERGAYMIGCLAAYETTSKKEYYDYALGWANKNNWSFHDDGSDWAYKNADYKICGQSYLKLMELDPSSGTMENMIRGMEIVLNDKNNDYWWWVDTIYMALPYYNMMGIKLNDSRYFEKVHALFINTKEERGLYDCAEHLWYRDENYLPDKARTASGKKIFWGRGNGWVIAGIARTLEVLPKTNKYYDEYLRIFKDMAKALRPWQQSDGAWRTSIIDPEEYDTPETSGTVLILYAYMLGINLGLLDDEYLEPVLRGFKWLSGEAMLESGKIGYVQVVAASPGPVDRNASNDYAVGTYLLLCRELVKYTERKQQAGAIE
ncbi:MAG TPA: glycoside hydrolase family 88 protein [Candidatus Ornithomonoglobus intestinigallinarum]|uniref:Glycoside hydrolase family 88 protein n=1 Tax=Candidatus Ornithomonoglobus intestinigallinarum TaxID=2840894 RepID=A0A9D1H1Y5_9FIRM|nr:glycoside hydrolase family 88 protein [Candidatus Ornithomonoglobus intestinigallinarum]